MRLSGNGLYIGRLVWNKQRYVKDPNTGKRLARVNPESQWIIREIPELRIIEDKLWDRVQARLAGIRDSAGVQKAREEVLAQPPREASANRLGPMRKLRCPPRRHG